MALPGQLRTRGMRRPARWGKVLGSLVEVTENSLRHQGLKPEQAREIAEHLIADIAHYFGGRPIYLPRGQSLTLGIRNARIYGEFTGDNVHDLADRYQLTAARIYKILEEERNAGRAERAEREHGAQRE